MKALQISGPGNVTNVELPAPEAGAGEVLLRMEYVGFCGSDLNTYRGRNAMAKSPVIPGHEIGAVIEAVGPGVPENLKPGMTVTVNPYTACGSCPSCRRGRPNACRSNQTLGVQRDGAMREFMAVPWEKVIPAGNLGTRETALVEPMSVGFHAVSRGAVTDIDTVMVIGCGMVGLGAVVRAALRGATVIAADIDEEKLLIAKQMGAAYALNTMAPGFSEKLAEVTGGDGPDVVVEAVGSPSTPSPLPDVSSASATPRQTLPSRPGYSSRRSWISEDHAMPNPRTSGPSSATWSAGPARRTPSSAALLTGTKLRKPSVSGMVIRVKYSGFF
jgi:threonine dehydrogenase-like Zn-dependent dehydrogenase